MQHSMFPIGNILGVAYERAEAGSTQYPQRVEHELMRLI